MTILLGYLIFIVLFIPVCMAFWWLLKILELEDAEESN